MGIVQVAAIFFVWLLWSVRKPYKGWREASKPPDNPEEWIANQQQEAIPEAIRDRAQVFNPALVENKFHFSYFETHISKPANHPTSLVWLSEDRTTLVTIGIEVNITYSIGILSIFEDNAALYTSNPLGHWVETPHYRARFAYNIYNALTYHQQQIPVMVATHGSAKLLDSLEEQKGAFELFSKQYRPYHIKRIVSYWFNQVIFYAVGFFGLVSIAAFILLTNRYQLSTEQPEYWAWIVLTLLFFFVPLGFVQWYERREYQYADAIDADTEPHPIYGGKKKKNDPPTGTHPLEDTND